MLNSITIHIGTRRSLSREIFLHKSCVDWSSNSRSDPTRRPVSNSEKTLHIYAHHPLIEKNVSHHLKKILIKSRYEENLLGIFFFIKENRNFLKKCLHALSSLCPLSREETTKSFLVYKKIFTFSNLSQFKKISDAKISYFFYYHCLCRWKSRFEIRGTGEQHCFSFNHQFFFVVFVNVV